MTVPETKDTSLTTKNRQNLCYSAAIQNDWKGHSSLIQYIASYKG